MEPAEGSDPLCDPEELRVLHAAFDSFRQYRQAAHYNVTHLRRESFYSLPTTHMDMLSNPPFSLPQTFRAVDDAIDANADIAEAMINFSAPMFGIDGNNEDWKGKARPNDMDKARSTIVQLYRDWSAEGAAERHACYQPILTALNTHLPTLESVTIPDIVPSFELATRPTSTNSEKPPIERLSMTSGDFCLVYQEPHNREQYDAVATCFFIDTAPNVIRYIETIKHCLKPGGIWINLGPLLWHFESSLTPAQKDRQRGTDDGPKTEDHASNIATEQGIGEPGSFELSNDEVIALLQQLGFEILERRDAPAGATGYMQDPRSMLQNVYRPAFWVAKKM
ncbi:hypothetical protein LTR37_014522 [Vermiconidia calcicola]|uniref:Uncharacterized protein n=1 Tax=Vermiconidia calcicola TaxID=1690605 RepID=A0ACC3MUW5_9PEZI|nr:hypothetical protein LTR37_014522 [Vermiconidia calcicola]